MLVNSEGNYAVILNSDNHRVDVAIYKSKDEYDNGLDPFFEKNTTASWHCGEAIKTAIDETPASGSGSKKIRDNINSAVGLVVETLAAEDDKRFRIKQRIEGEDNIIIPGDWTIWVATV